MRAWSSVALLIVLAAVASACSDDFEGCENCGGPDAASGGAAGTGAGGGTGGSAGSLGGSSGSDAAAGASGSAGSDAGEAGVPCTKVYADCEADQVCDPVTKTCGPVQCSLTKSCDSTSGCSFQDGLKGVCYPKCDLGGTPCPGGDTCVPTLGSISGVCIPPGGGAQQGECDYSSSLTTGCEVLYACVEESGNEWCHEICDFWGSPGGGCGLGKCAPIGVCMESGQPVALGQPCAQGDFSPCGADATHWQGVCVIAGADPVCLEFCRTAVGSDCPTPKTCLELSPGDPVGVCG